MTARKFWNSLTTEGRTNVLFKIGETAIPYVLDWDTLPVRVRETLADRWGFAN